MITQILTPSVQVRHEVEYPDSDGEPMAESDFQYKYLAYCRNSLAIHFQHEPQVYVSGNLLIYYEEGNPRKSVSPDVFVTFGIPKRDRFIYKTWEEGKAPDVVIEITSKTTEKKDRVFKSILYSQLGVKEYFMYDPTGDYLNPTLQGFWRDEDGSYQEIMPDYDGDLLKLESHLLRLELHLQTGRLRLYNPEIKSYLMSHEEAQTAQLEEAQARQAAEARAQAAELAVRIEASARQAELAARLELEARLRELEAKLAQQ